MPEYPQKPVVTEDGQFSIATCMVTKQCGSCTPRNWRNYADLIFNETGVLIFRVWYDVENDDAWGDTHGLILEENLPIMAAALPHAKAWIEKQREERKRG
jgi:hypothetical protein